MKIKVVRNYQHANVLLDKKHKLLKIDRDKFNRDYLVFIFEYSDDLIRDLLNINK